MGLMAVAGICAGWAITYAEEQAMTGANGTASVAAQPAPMTPMQAVDLLDRFRQIAILPNSALRDHVMLQEAITVLREFVAEKTKPPEPVAVTAAPPEPENK